MNTIPPEDCWPPLALEHCLGEHLGDRNKLELDQDESRYRPEERPGHPGVDNDGPNEEPGDEHPERVVQESEGERLGLEGLSGASAGAMNAVLLAYGLTRGGRHEARRVLTQFWQRIATATRLSPVQSSVLDDLAGGYGLEWSPGFRATETLSHYFSPYELNPWDLHPLREILLALIDFDHLREPARSSSSLRRRGSARARSGSSRRTS